MSSNYKVSSEIFEVEKVVSRLLIKGKMYYFLKYKGFDHSHNSWEPLENLDCDELIQQFENEIAFCTPEQVVKKGNHRSSTFKKAKKHFETVKQGLFLKGFKAERILGATTKENKIVFLIKWYEKEVPDFVYAEEMNENCPEMVIKFYEDHLNRQSIRVVNLNEIEVV